ncbi:class I SAM-dependent methyltransferase [Angelakisella massiliensis]|uniref:class I SAM-dependent methyltransferase n=1 Tax=Angelakisella massiliensis TaxID=1871018 RepID=UPI0008F8F4A3|nr:methyltransferase domain-containing protein [Angelakisella massiliensis]
MGKYDFGYIIDEGSTNAWARDMIPPKSKVLELGSSMGYLTKSLAEKGCCVDIVELDEESGCKAQIYAENALIGPSVGDIEKLIWTKKFRQQTYDAVVILDVLEHLRNPEEVLQEASKMLNPMGKLYISVPNIAHNAIILNLINNKWEYTPLGLLDDTHIHFFTYNSLVKIFRRLGLKIEYQGAIQKAVGDIEINNSYEDVSMEIAEGLKLREYPDAYQFLFSLSLQDDDKFPVKMKLTNLPATSQGIEFYYQYPGEEILSETLHKEYYQGTKFAAPISVPSRKNVFPEKMMISFPMHNVIIKSFVAKNAYTGEILDDWYSNGLNVTDVEMLFNKNNHQIILTLPAGLDKIYLEWELLFWNSKTIDYLEEYMQKVCNEKLELQKAVQSDMVKLNTVLEAERNKSKQLGIFLEESREKESKLDQVLQAERAKSELLQSFLNESREKENKLNQVLQEERVKSSSLETFLHEEQKKNVESGAILEELKATILQLRAEQENERTLWGEKEDKMKRLLERIRQPKVWHIYKKIFGIHDDEV